MSIKRWRGVGAECEYQVILVAENFVHIYNISEYMKMISAQLQDKYYYGVA